MHHVESGITLAAITVGDELLRQNIKAPSSKWVENFIPSAKYSITVSADRG